MNVHRNMIQVHRTPSMDFNTSQQNWNISDLSLDRQKAPHPTPPQTRANTLHRWCYLTEAMHRPHHSPTSSFWSHWISQFKLIWFGFHFVGNLTWCLFLPKTCYKHKRPLPSPSYLLLFSGSAWVGDEVAIGSQLNYSVGYEMCVFWRSHTLYSYVHI